MRPSLLALSALLLAAPVTAQFAQSQSYKFLQAVKDAKGEEVTTMLDTPGQTIVNTRDPSTGEGALHIVTKRGDLTYLRYLLGRGADKNIRDARGNTPMMLAVELGHAGIVEQLTALRANPNLGNQSGETPLIRAVQRRDLPMVRLLLAANANPDQSDSIAGMSARDYAGADGRAPAIQKLIEETARTRSRPVAGPGM